METQPRRQSTCVLFLHDRLLRHGRDIRYMGNHNIARLRQADAVALRPPAAKS